MSMKPLASTMLGTSTVMASPLRVPWAVAGTTPSSVPEFTSMSRASRVTIAAVVRRPTLSLKPPMRGPPTPALPLAVPYARTVPATTASAPTLRPAAAAADGSTVKGMAPLA